MDAGRWQRVQNLFHETLARPEPEREAFLRAECGDDAALVNEVLALMAEDARADSLLEQDLAHVAHGIFDAVAPNFQSIGRYRIVRVLGQGGMGVVYLAEHLGRRVAIKVLRDASLSPVRRERFEREQQTLAQLTHSSIARLYEADVLADGTPYFVMEYVEGVSITDYCVAHACDVPRRLALFRAVCEAVQYAHRQAVIHRDLKPSNILVTSDGTVRLLDFGIATHVDNLDRSAAWTQTGQQLMTPAYAAPEQLRRQTVGVYTDIYALGVILYELLCGGTPFDLGDLTPGQAEALILDQEPERPSSRARRSPAAPTRSAPSRAQWVDLDVLCATAMHKDPQRRYASVDSLIRDLDHYRNNGPLDARPDQLGYRLGKFVQRHRRAVAGSAAALVAIIGIAAFYTARLAEQRTLARAEAAKARELSEYLIGLFDAGDPFAESVDKLDVRKLLDRGAERAEGLAAQPQVQAQMFNALGRVYTMLSEYERAETLLQRALTLRTTGEQPLDLADTLANLGALRRYTSELESAEKFTREALAIRERHLPPMHPDLAASLDNLGVILSNRDEYAQASEALTRALEIRRKSYVQPHPLVGHTLNNLAVNEFNEGNYDAAERYYREALEVSKATYGPDHAYTAVDLANLGVLLDTKGNYDEADVMLTEALRITQLRLGEDHYETAFRMTQLGGMLRRKGDYDRAEAYLRKSMEIEGRVLEANHRNHGATLNHLALTLQEKGQYAAAEPFLRRSVEVFRASLGPEHPFTGTVTCSLGFMLHLQHRNAEGERYMREGLQILTDALPAGHDMIALNESRYGALLIAESRFEEAEPLLTHSYEVLLKTFGERHKDTVQAASRLTELYDAWKRPEQ
jgi:serine/threonine-protein kinase